MQSLSVKYGKDAEHLRQDLRLNELSQKVKLYHRLVVLLQNH